MKQYRVAILGASGAVGQEMMKILAERKFPVGELHLLASARSAGKVVSWQGQDIVVEEATDAAFAGMDIVLGAAENDIAERFAPAIVRSGAVFVDNSSAFRLDPNVPLVVPEINAGDVKLHHGIISNPNCSTIITLTAINALRNLSPIHSMVVSTYQAVSGAGAGGPIELQNEVDALRAGKPYAPKVFAHQIAYNVIPQIGGEQCDGYTSEEMKLQNEGRKILHLPDMNVACTCVRVPVVRSHSISAAVHFAHHISVDEARAAIAAAPGCRLVDDLDALQYPMPLDTSDRRPHPPRPDRPQRPVPLVLRRPGAQGRGHQLRADRRAADPKRLKKRKRPRRLREEAAGVFVLRYMAAGSAPLRKRRGCGIRRIQHTVMAGEPDD